MALDEQGNHVPGTRPDAPRTAAEVGSPEFAEDRTQVNSLNNKLVFEAAHTYLSSERQQISARLVTSLDHLIGLQQKLDHQIVQGLTDRSVYGQGWEYNRQYDLANPVAVGAGANLTAGSAPANRIVDTTGAVAGGAVSMSGAMSALNNATAQIGILTTMVDELAQSQHTANTQIATSLDAVNGILSKLADAVLNLTPTPAAVPSPTPAA